MLSTRDRTRVKYLVEKLNEHLPGFRSFGITDGIIDTINLRELRQAIENLNLSGYSLEYSLKPIINILEIVARKQNGFKNANLNNRCQQIFRLLKFELAKFDAISDRAITPFLASFPKLAPLLQAIVAEKNTDEKAHRVVQQDFEQKTAAKFQKNYEPTMQAVFSALYNAKKDLTQYTTSLQTDLKKNDAEQKKLFYKKYALTERYIFAREKVDKLEEKVKQYERETKATKTIEKPQYNHPDAWFNLGFTNRESYEKVYPPISKVVPDKEKRKDAKFHLCLCHENLTTALAELETATLAYPHAACESIDLQIDELRKESLVLKIQLQKTQPIVFPDTKKIDDCKDSATKIVRADKILASLPRLITKLANLQGHRERKALNEVTRLPPDVVNIIVDGTYLPLATTKGLFRVMKDFKISSSTPTSAKSIVPPAWLQGIKGDAKTLKTQDQGAGGNKPPIRRRSI